MVKVLEVVVGSTQSVSSAVLWVTCSIRGGEAVEEQVDMGGDDLVLAGRKHAGMAVVIVDKGRM